MKDNEQQGYGLLASDYGIPAPWALGLRSWVSNLWSWLFGSQPSDLGKGNYVFKDVSQVTDALGGQQYIASNEIGTVIFLAERLGKPILAEGPAGVGKTELAKAWAAATGRTLIRLQCYEGLDETKALYEWEYAKQLLYTQLLRDKLNDMLGGVSTLGEAADRLASEEDVFFSRRFLLPRPLLQAITSDEPVTLLSLRPSCLKC
jgi:MoxR-like ATPase